MLIALEGADCVGKTTLMDALALAIEKALDRKVMLLAFPSTGIAGSLARECMAMPPGWNEIAPAFGRNALAYIIQCLMNADRYNRVGQIQGHIRKGGIVLVSRWTMSAEVYGELDGIDGLWLQRTQQMLPAPDLTLLLDADVATASARQKERRRPPDIYEFPDFQERVIERYHFLWQHRAVNTVAWARLDARQSLGALTIEALAAIYKCAQIKLGPTP
jgi:thymidylate kinase